MEGSKIIEASKLPMGIGLVVILISMVIAAISLFGGDAVKQVVGIVSLAYGISSYLIFMLLFGWAGYRAVKKFGLDLMGAAAVGALSALAVGIAGLVLSFVMLAVAVGAAAATTTDSGTSTAAFAGVFGIISVMLGIFWIIGSTVINAVVAAIGGLLAKGK